MKTFALVNGKVISHNRIYEACVVVKDGKIEKVIEGKCELDHDMEIIDITGKYVMPGAIDAHVHFRSPGYEHKEDWETGSKAALAGGVTTVFDMPNVKPPTVSVDTLDEKRKMVAEKSLVNFGLFLGATPDNLDEAKKAKNIPGVKFYMGTTTGDMVTDDLNLLEKFLSETDHMITVHAEDEACIQTHAKEYEGIEDPSVHSKIRDPECANKATHDAIHLAKKCGHRLHIAHMSTEHEMMTVKKFKDVPITCEVTPHHLFYNDHDYEGLGTKLRMNPPVRPMTDQVKLWEGIKSGIVDIVATDHAPHTEEEKAAPYSKAPSGVPGVQTMLPLLLNEARKGIISYEKVVELVSYNPAKIYKVKNKGEITEGFDADLTVLDLSLKAKVERDYLFSKCGWSPWEGRELTGWPVMTFVGGNLMYEWRDKFGSEKGNEVQFA
ncbi:amidohydrolase family protein [Candidatus Peregrinibacteria bacterium]|nr:amidohydrolase family protein [Candidatus Peregrinibacteria bacterium]